MKRLIFKGEIASSGNIWLKVAEESDPEPQEPLRFDDSTDVPQLRSHIAELGLLAVATVPEPPSKGHLAFVFVLPDTEEVRRRFAVEPFDPKGGITP